MKQGMTKILERFSKPIQFCSHIFFHIRGNVVEDRDYFSPFFPRCKTAFLSFGVMNILGGIIVWCGGCLVEHCRLFSSSPGLYSIDARSTSQLWKPKMFPDIARCPLWVRCLPFWTIRANYCIFFQHLRISFKNCVTTIICGYTTG